MNTFSNAHPHPPPRLPPPSIHHPARAWWIVGEQWTEMIPLNSSHSSRFVSANSTHGNCGRGRGVGVSTPSAQPPRNLPPGLSVWIPRQCPAMGDHRVFSVFRLCSHLVHRLRPASIQFQVQFSFNLARRC